MIKVLFKLQRITLLSYTPQDPRLNKILDNLRLQKRGTGGVDTAAVGGIFDISNLDRLGLSEVRKRTKRDNLSSMAVWRRIGLNLDNYCITVSTSLVLLSSNSNSSMTLKRETGVAFITSLGREESCCPDWHMFFVVLFFLMLSHMTDMTLQQGCSLL